MNTLTIRFNEIDAIPHGRYLVRIIDVQQRQSRSAAPYLSWKLEIIDGPHAGRFVFFATSLLPKARAHLKRFLSTLAIPFDGHVLELNLHHLTGRRLWIRLTPDEFDGKLSYHIFDYGPVDVC